MYLKKNCRLLICFFVMLSTLLLGLVGCSKDQSNLPYDNKIDVSEVATQKFSEDIQQLNVPYVMQMSMSIIYNIEELQSKGIVQTVRYNKGRYYSITPIQDNKYLILLYSNNQQPIYVVDGFLVSTLADKTVAKDFAVGMSRDEILKKDSSAYTFENRSYHRFSDKSMLCIKYEVNDKNQYIASEIENLNDSDSVLDYLLDKDFDIITAS